MLLQREGGHQLVTEAQTPESRPKFLCGIHHVSLFVSPALRKWWVFGGVFLLVIFLKYFVLVKCWIFSYNYCALLYQMG